MGFFAFLWWAMTLVQQFMGWGTAYRLTKSGGDNGVALWGWMLVMGLAALVPGLGIYLWFKYKDEGNHNNKGKIDDQMSSWKD